MAKLITTLGVAAALCGCGSAAPRSTAPPVTPPDQRVRVQGGTIVFRGDVAPDSSGPLTLTGRYRATFSQGGPGVDFAAEVPFTAHLEQPRASGAPREIALFQAARRTGAATFTARGRWELLVDFGDSPFVITLTPAAGG